MRKPATWSILFQRTPSNMTHDKQTGGAYVRCLSMQRMEAVVLQKLSTFYFFPVRFSAKFRNLTFMVPSLFLVWTSDWLYHLLSLQSLFTLFLLPFSIILCLRKVWRISWFQHKRLGFKIKTNNGKYIFSTFSQICFVLLFH